MLSHILLHCSDALCMKLRIYKGKHDKYCTSFTLLHCIYNVVVVVVVEHKFQFNYLCCNDMYLLMVDHVSHYIYFIIIYCRLS